MNRSAWLMAIFLGVAGCVDVHAVTLPGSSLAQTRRYAFAPPNDADQAGFMQSPTGQTIHSQIARGLGQRGLIEVRPEERPDVWVVYYFVVEEKQSAAYTSPYGPLYWAAPRTVRYMRSTVVVDLVDPGGIVRWRGTAAGIVDHPENPPLPRIAAAVDKLMLRYPIHR